MTHARPSGKRSAGVLLYRAGECGIEVLLVHPGGPYWAKKDLGAWSIPKGEHSSDEDPRVAAVRELREETGLAVEGRLVPLGELQQPSGKRVTAFALRGDFDPAALVSNTFTIEWPPRSGRRLEAPEVDRTAWFSLDEARVRLLRGQRPFLDRLLVAIADDWGAAHPGA